jgi:Tol biopolymer transport system component
MVNGKFVQSLIIVLIFILQMVSCTTGIEEPITELPPSENFDAHYGTWNADGTKILFHHTDLSGSIPKQYQLYVADLQAGERYKVFEGPSLNPDWSPNGDWIAFHSNSVPSSIYKFRSNDSTLVRLTGDGTPTENYSNWHTIIARWNPAGDEILFSAGSSDENRGAVIMNSDGSDAEIVVPFAIGANWFPNGESIVYVYWDTDQPTNRQRQLYMARADGSQPTKLTDLENSDYISSPVVSPDGTKIAFLHRPGQSTDIYVLNLHDNSIDRLTTLNNQGVARAPRWHPAGHKILFTVRDINVSRRLYTIHPSSGEIEAVFPEQ